MSVHGKLSTGEDAELVAFDGNHLSFRTPRAFAPGAPVELRFELSGAPLAVQAKAHGSKREPDGLFVVRGRTIGQRREDREALLAALGGGSPSP
ncbi:MAG: hypothetical protein U0230_21260 [Polyangiales bacterium]